MKAFAFAGALDANGARAEKLAADLVSHIERESLVLFGYNSNAGLWFSHLLKTAQGPRLIELAAKWDCDQIKQVIESPSMRDHAVRVEPLWARCDAKQGLPQEPQQVDSTRRSEEELVASFSKRDPKDTADLNRLEVAEEIAVLVRRGDEQKAVAFLKDIGDQRREDLLEELGTNTLGSIVVHIKSRNDMPSSAAASSQRSRRFGCRRSTIRACTDLEWRPCRQVDLSRACGPCRSWARCRGSRRASSPRGPKEPGSSGISLVGGG